MKNSKTNSGLTLAEIAALVGGSVEGDPEVIVRSAAPIQTAGPDDLSFVANPKYAKFTETTKAGALVLGPDIKCDRVPVIRHEKPYLAFAQVVDLLYPDQQLVPVGIDASAIVDKTAKIDASAAIGPLCHVGRNSSIGKNSQLVGSVHIADNVVIGDDCLIYPRASILADSKISNHVIIHSGVVIGSDGFGFAETDTGLKKIKQVGWVEIANDVEIGANTTIDRGAIGPTKIGPGTKIDNLVQIAHNVEIGAHSIIVAQVGISGSTKIGNGVILAGQAGLVGHIEIGDGARVGAQSGIAKSIPPGVVMFGSPARKIMDSKRIEASLTRLPDLFKRVRAIEAKLPDDSGE